MQRFLRIFLISMLPLCAEYSIIFVHIGDHIPPYTAVALEQARRFNPHANIILLGSKKGLERFVVSDSIHLQPYEEVPLSDIHQVYQKRCHTVEPFWRYTSERFLYLYDFITAYALDNSFHFENDTMLYADLEPLLPLFQTHYPGIGAPFDNDERCIADFVWIANPKAMQALAEYFVEKARYPLSDMYVLGHYRQTHPPSCIGAFPIIMPEYLTLYPLKSALGHTTTTPSLYAQHAELFQAIFDAAALGQYLGGNDPMHAINHPGFINESCLFNPAHLQYIWCRDEEGRAVPYVKIKDAIYRIMNLHIHSKRLQDFCQGDEI